MTANEWLGVMQKAQDFPKGMEKLIVKYGEMLIAEHESKVKKLTIPDVSKQRELLEIFYKRMVGRTEMHDSDEYFMDEIMKIFQ